MPDTQTNPQTSILKPKLQAMPAKIHPSPQQQANTSTQTPKVFRSKSGTKKRASYAEEPTSALLDHDSDRVVYPEPQELFYTPTSSDIDASPNNSTQASPALPTTSNESTQTDAPPETASGAVQTSPNADDIVCTHTAPQKPEVTLRDAFGYAFSMAADIETAQEMFRDACADHVYPVNSYKREEFISLLKDKLGYRARFASKEFFQVFMNIAAFVHQYVDPGLDHEIAATFAQAQKGPKWVFASWLAPRMQCKFNDGMHTHYICHLEHRFLMHDIPEPGEYVEMACMRKSAEYNARLIKAAGHCVDPRKVSQDHDRGDKWEQITAKRHGANCFL